MKNSSLNYSIPTLIYAVYDSLLSGGSLSFFQFFIIHLIEHF